jgi:hypothetical protein
MQLRRNKNANNVTAVGKKPVTIPFIKMNSFVDLSASAPSSDMKQNKTKVIKIRILTELLHVCYNTAGSLRTPNTYGKSRGTN